MHLTTEYWIHLSAYEMSENPDLSESICCVCYGTPKESKDPWVAHEDVNQRAQEIANQKIRLIHPMHESCAKNWCKESSLCPYKDVHLRFYSLFEIFSKLFKRIPENTGKIVDEMVEGISASMGTLAAFLIINNTIKHSFPNQEIKLDVVSLAIGAGGTFGLGILTKKLDFSDFVSVMGAMLGYAGSAKALEEIGVFTFNLEGRQLLITENISELESYLIALAFGFATVGSVYTANKVKNYIENIFN